MDDRPFTLVPVRQQHTEFQELTRARMAFHGERYCEMMMNQPFLRTVGVTSILLFGCGESLTSPEMGWTVQYGFHALAVMTALSSSPNGSRDEWRRPMYRPGYIERCRSKPRKGAAGGDGGVGGESVQRVAMMNPIQGVWPETVARFPLRHSPCPLTPDA